VFNKRRQARQKTGPRSSVGKNLHILETSSKAALAEASRTPLPYEDRDPAALPKKSIHAGIFFQVAAPGLILRAFSRLFDSIKFPDSLKPKLQDAAVSLRGKL
jgi:hypothetical protein